MSRSLATPEMVKNSIISEIEENLSTQRQSIMQDDLLGLCADRDCLVTPFALQKAINYGIDPRYTAPKHSSGESASSSVNHVEKERLQDESIIEDQFDEFLSRLELLDSEDYNGMVDDELDFSIKERLLMIKVEKAVFDPLLLLIRTSRPALYQAVIQHSLIVGQQKSNKKLSKKEKKRDRKNEMNREKEKMLAQSRMTRSQRRDKSSFSVDSVGAIGTLADLRASPEKRAVSNRETLAAMVAKTVAESSLSGHLLAIALLTQIMKDERAGGSSAVSAIPIGNVLAGLFERSDGDDESDTSDVAGASSTQNSTGSTRDNPYLANPFHSYLLSPRDEPAKSVAYSDMSRGDIGSLDETRTEDTASQLGVGEGSVGYPGPHSDAGSTVGSTRAEQGTETASVDEDATEDEQLAQALAMSMRGAVVNSSTDPSAAYEVSIRAKPYSAHSSAASSSGSVSFTGERSMPPAPHSLPRIEPLSTFGPFSSPEYWRVLSSNDYPEHPGDIPMVSLRHTVIALLTVIRAGSDRVLGEDFSLSMLSPSSSGSIFEARQGPLTAYISSTPPITPSPLVFLLLELLLDQLLQDLKTHCKSSQDGQTSPRKDLSPLVETVNSPLTQNMLKERERKGKQTLFASNTTESLSDQEVEAREWAFHRYYLVWAIHSILRVLRASLSVAKESRCSHSSLGLGQAGDSEGGDLSADSDSKIPRSNSFPSSVSTSEFTRTSTASVQPLALKLLQHVEVCVGLSLDCVGAISIKPVVLDDVLSPQTQRDAQCINLLKYPIQQQAQSTKGPSQSDLTGSVSGNVPHYPEQHSVLSYRHVLRLSGIDCCISGLAVFRPLQGDRESLLLFLLRNAPEPKEGRQPEYASELFGLVTARTGTGGDSRAVSGSMTYFLQETCLSFAQSLSKLRAGASSLARAPQGVKLGSPPLGDCESPVKGKNFSGKSGPSKELNVLELENILFKRLKFANLTKIPSVSESVGTSAGSEDFLQGLSPPKNLVFWGELQLLHTLQKRYMKDFSHSTGGGVLCSPSQICFNVRRCHQDIAISGDSKVVTHRNSKLWASISALKSFSPGSGVHEWALRIDKSDRGHVFVGVVTADASMDSYIGSDRFGWGIIGTRGLWHGRAKVASDFGSGFGNQSVVRLRLDTDQGTLSISTSDFVWAVAFENLPGVELFPAVSLYHRDDCISLVPTEASSSSPISPSASVESPTPKDRVGSVGGETIVSYVRYAQTLCAHVDGLLRTADSLKSPADRAAVLSHPFIGLLLPSVAAAALEAQSPTQDGPSPFTGGYLAVQLVPYFTVMAKRLSSLQESVGSAREVSGGKPLSVCGFIGNIGGLWTLHSAPSPCNTIAAQKYKLNIDYPFIPLGLKAAHHSSAPETPGKASGGHYLAAARIAGSGRFSSVSVTLSGTQLGTRLKFLEKWSTGSGCLLDVRLSLCGGFFSGTYTDIKSGKSGDVEGCRTSLQATSPSTVREALSKSCLLCTMVCGKLAANLVSLQCPPIPALTDLGSGVVVDSPVKRTDADGEALEEGEDEDKTAALNEAGLKEKGHLTLVKWLRSDLFSGGLPMDASLTRYLDEEIRTFISLQRAVVCTSPVPYLPAPSTPKATGRPDSDDTCTLQSAAEDSDPSHSFRGLMVWWLEKVFPTFIVTPKKKGHSAKKMAETLDAHKKLSFLEDAPAPSESFILDLAEHRGAGKRVDEYVSHHVGISALSKMGGGPTQVARRLVVAALIKHSGCVSICLAEDEALSSGMKVLSDRPTQLLVDVWRSAQRCVEHAIRSKKGSSYDSVSAMLGKKAELLLELTPNSVGLAVQDAHTVTAAEMQRHHQQLLLCPQLSGTHDSRMEVPSEALEDSSKQLAAASEFLMSPLRDTAQLRALLLRASFDTVTRIAGLKSFMLLFNRVEEAEAPSTTGRLPALSAIGMQPAAIEYLFLAFRGLSDDVTPPAPKGPAPSPSAAPATPGASPPAATSDTPSNGLSGHYSDGLHGVSSALMDDLKNSFESMFEFITQLLSRCTWAGDRDGQCISLVCWGIRIKPDDHVFLNRTTGIFRVLQTVLDDARTSMALAADKARAPGASPGGFKSPSTLSSGTGGVFTMSLLEHRQGPYGAEMMQNTLKRLAQLVLKVVHSLASQVAFCKDGSAPLGSTPSAPRLQRMPSGPDTLSQSLFDMLYAELFCGWKAIIAQSDSAHTSQPSPAGRASTPLSAASSKVVSDGRQDDLLEGEQYIYRILRLLYFVSISKVCQRSLSSPKWLSLLLLSFGCGGFSTQRRTLRLLRRLLMNMDPKDFRALVPSLCGGREEMTQSDSPFDEDDVNSFIKEQDEEVDSGGERITCTERLVRLFLEGASVILSTSAEEDRDQATSGFHTQLDLNNTREALSTECVAALRFLQTLPPWREVIVRNLHKVLRGHAMRAGPSSLVKWGDSSSLRTTAASLGVIGGYVDYLRVGGIVTLRPFCLIGPTDTLASRLAGVYHCCAMLVSQTPQNGVVEVVLMERSSKPVREGGGKEKVSSQHKSLQYNATTLSTALPVRAVRVNASDIVPSPDVPVVPEFTTTAVFNDVLNIMHSYSIPWLKVSTRRKASKECDLDLKEGESEEKSAAAPESKDEEAAVRLEYKAQEEEEEEEDMEEEDMEEEDFSAENNDDDEDIFHTSRSTAGEGAEALTGQDADILAALPPRGSKTHTSPSITSPRDGPKVDPLEAPPTVEQEVEALQTFVNLSAFRAFATSLQCNVLVYALVPDSAKVGADSSVKAHHTTSATPSPSNSRPSSPVSDSLSKEEEVSAELKRKILEDVISLAVQETNCGGVCVIEAVEERWTALWGAYEAISRRRRDPKESGGRGPLDSPPSSKGSFSAVEILRTRAVDPVVEADTFTRHISRNIIASNPLLDAAASIGLFSHFGSQLASRASATVDPATQAAAIAQMTDMGLPRDWCEVALRRCRYNVELAINMCFENGGDMPQIVAEDAIMQAAQASRRENESSSTRRHRPARDELGREESGHDGREGREGSSAAARIQYLMSHARHLDASASEPGARHLSLASRIASDHHRRVMTLRPPVPASSSAATSAMVSQLLDMGFPPHWCARAMHATNNDVDAALSWILSHGEELVADGVMSVGENEPAASDPFVTEDAPPTGDSDQSLERKVNPLSTVSGSSEVRDSDLTCTALNGGFPSVGCRGFPVFTGKWYFELKVHTAGCVQVGWVDSAYDGGADIGEGVGDDSHSWAFDGWRMYLWHELSAEWGAKWSPGDVVGCAVDLDQRSMSFFLNGLGEEVDMGLAFTSMDVSGGLYPCASFNRGEVIQFNFGSSPFAYGPPEGYLPYAQHVHASMSENTSLRMTFPKQLRSLISCSSTSKHEIASESKWSGLSAAEKAQIRGDLNAESKAESGKIFFFENSLEEIKGEREFYGSRRYFPTDDTPRSGSIGERPLRYPSAVLSARIPRDREGLIRQIESVSRDLCILYCRMAVFRILRSFPKLKDKKSTFLELLMARRRSDSPTSTSASLSNSDVTNSSEAIDESDRDQDGGRDREGQGLRIQWEDSPFDEHRQDQGGSAMDQVLLLIRQSCASTQRTKIYLQTVAMLHSVSHLPQNIGSVFGAGGAPMLEQLRHCLSDMLTLSLTPAVSLSPPSPPSHSSLTNSSAPVPSPSALVDILLGHIQVDTANAVRRDLASEWRLEGGLAPMICKDITLSDAACINLPSLALAVWMTNLVVSLYVEREKTSPSDGAQQWVVQLARSWTFSLRSPSLPVKTCAAKMLCAILSCCPASSLSSSSYSSSLTSSVVAEIPIDRLRLLCQTRLAKEKGSLPVCSEFLQCLLELVALASEDLGPVTPQAEVGAVSAAAETKKETEDADEYSSTASAGNDNWEALSGRIFSDEGLETWTGHVSQAGITELPSAVQRLQERQDLPPELMPGCKVCRKRVHSPRDGAATSPTPSADSPEAALIGPPGLGSTLRKPLGEPLWRDSEETPATSPTLLGDVGFASSKIVKIDLEDQLGTVLEVSTWTGHPPGSARLIKWDDEVENELVRWDAEDGAFDVTHVKLKNGKISVRYPHPHPRQVKIANRFFGLALTYGVILRLKKEKLRGDEEEGVTGRFQGVMEWPDFTAVVSVSGVLFSDGGRVITEEALLSGPCHTGWDTRFAQSSWRSGTTYRISANTPFSSSWRESVPTPTATPSASAGNAGNTGSSSPSPSSSCQSKIDITDSRNGELRGTFSYHVLLSDKMVGVTGELFLQQSRLFVFDEKNSYYNITVSSDKMTVAKNGGSGQACAFGSVGFSSGIHYWEFKIEQADVGSIFLGVAEKPGAIGSSQASRFGRWVGSGLANHRASFRSSSQTTGDRLSVYGDHFHTGDTVGVLLDMNRGRLSFYLDGLKYGQHTIMDLGEAFDGLTQSSQVKKRTMFPIVGLSKSQDRIAITPRWLSCMGTEQGEEVLMVGRAHQLLAAWSAPPPSALSSSSSITTSSSLNILHDPSSWLFREAYSDWKRWKSARYIRVRSRCQAAGPMVAVDVTPRACAEACIRLGLPYALLRGDRVLFSRSSGRKLDTKEEAVILGAYKGQLWYRLDSQQSQADGGIMESAALAWSLVPSDMEGLTLLRRSYTSQPVENAESFGMVTNLDTVGGFFRDSGSSSGDSTCSSNVTTSSEEEVTMKAVAELPLPRIPSFQGGLVLVTYANGAVMRDGLEIDTSEVLCSVPAETVVYALEQRLNSSNVWRLRVLYGGHYGWISERMRGGSEEFMLQKVENPTPEALERAIKAAAEALAELHIPDRVRWDVQPSIAAAMEKWDDMVLSIGRGDVLEVGKEPTESFEEFCDLARPDAQCDWSVETDMQLADYISQCAAKEGSTPQNVSADRVGQAVRASGNYSDSFGTMPLLSEGSLLCGVHADRVVARASLLRVANQTLRYALPYINMTLLEEKQRKDCFGSDDAIDIDPTPIPQKDSDTAAAQSTPPLLFSPPSTARRLRALRRLLFGHTKSSFFESVLEATTTPTPLHQDEYEDPREIKTLRVNRVRATQSRLATITSPIERMRQTVFGQLHRELRAWPSAAFRRSYVGKGHGGQRRAFKVKFMGEGVNDYGGPYRAVFEQVVDELQADSALVGRKPSERALLPLLMPSANRSSSAGANQDKFVLSTAPCSPLHQELAQFFGKLLGAAVRHNLTLALDLSPMLWRPLVRLPVSRVHLQAVDAFFANTLADVTRVGLAHEAQAAASELIPSKLARSKEDILSLSEAEVEERELEGALLDVDCPTLVSASPLPTEAVQPEEWADLTFSVYLPDGTRMPLVSGGEEFPVTLDNWREYVQLAERVRLREGFVMYKVLRDGLSSVLPVELLPLFTPQEIEQLVSGTSTVDVALLRQCTDYEDLSPDSQLVKNFWEVLEGMTPEQHTLFLRFVWARSRMPASAQDLPMNFKLQSGQGAAREKPDSYLPHAQTCFFSLSIPAYSTKEILRAKLLYAINNSPTMDADVRLHSAEGWADS